MVALKKCLSINGVRSWSPINHAFKIINNSSGPWRRTEIWRNLNAIKLPWQLILNAFACIIIACFTCTFLNYTIFGMFIVFVWLNGISYLIEIPYHFPNLIKHNLIDRAYWSDLVEFNRYKYAGLSSIMLPRLMKSIKTGIFLSVCVFNNID